MEELKKSNDLEKKRYKLSCCRSYLTPKGRCYTCPELKDELEELDYQKDPEEEL